MERESTKRIMLIIIVILTISFAILIISFKKTKGKPRLFQLYQETNIENDDNDNKIEDDKCEKNKIAFKFVENMSYDYSSLVKNFDYTIMTRYYCYNDVCKNLEKQLIDYYKENNPNSKKTSGFATYIVRLSNGILKETIDNKTTALSEPKNVKSVIAYIDVSKGVELVYLDTSGNLYSYVKDENGRREPKLIYSRVKDFTVIEGNNYLSNILPSEGQNTTIVLHTKDNKTMISYYGFNKFIDISNINYNVLTSKNGDFLNIYVSSSNDYSYEKHNNKEIIVKELFVANDKLFLITKNDELLVTNVFSDHCNDDYKLYKENIIKKYLYNKNNSIEITFDNDAIETIKYDYKLNL